MTAAGVHGSLLLLRHGETTWTRERRVIGRQPVPLSEAGRAQSRAVASVLRTLAPQHLVTSPLARARETAEIVAAALGCPLAVDDDLAELDFGRWEGRTYDELLDDPQYLAFARRPTESAPPGGEGAAAAQARGLAAVQRALATRPGARICLVGHGDQIRLLLAAFLGLDAGEFRRLRIDTCGLSAVELGRDGAEVKFVNLLADSARAWERLHWSR